MDISELQGALARRRVQALRGSPDVYELIREDIVEGRLAAGARLKVGELSLRYGTSTNPVREALQQLRGEGFVQFSYNRGARVRPIDEAFIRDVYEVTALIEPHMTQWFTTVVTDDQIRRLEAVQDEIEAAGFDNPEVFSALDERFHRIVYDDHYNRHAVDIWWRHREILRAIGRRFAFSGERREQIVREHRELIACLHRRDADSAAAVIRRHVEGSGRHLTTQLRAHPLPPATPA